MNGAGTSELCVDALDGQGSWRSVHWYLAGALLVIEVVVSVGFASVNPAVTWDEASYLTAAHHFRGPCVLPYPDHRPPLLPMLIALMGDHSWLLPALAHLTGAAALFLVLRRLTSPAVALGGTAVFVLSGDMRYFGMLVLTEMGSVSLLLILLLFCLTRRPLWVGAAGSLLLVNHWQMVTVLPAVLVVYALRRRWRFLGWVMVGAGAMIAPFLIASTVVYGNPVHPFLLNLTMNTVAFDRIVGKDTPNDLLFYWRSLPPTLWILVLGSVAAIGWLAVGWRRRRSSQRYAFVAVVISVTIIQLIPMHLVVPKDTRLFVPLVPLLLLASVLMADQWWRRSPRAGYVAWPLLVVSVCAVMPDRTLRWEIHDMRNHPMHQVMRLRDTLATTADDTVLYSDVNDLAVQAHLQRRTIPVAGADSRHYRFMLRERGVVTRETIPADALYLTWHPGTGEVVASVEGNPRGVLYLVRWRRPAAPRRDVVSAANSR